MSKRPYEQKVARLLATMRTRAGWTNKTAFARELTRLLKAPGEEPIHRNEIYRWEDPEGRYHTNASATAEVFYAYMLLCKPGLEDLELPYAEEKIREEVLKRFGGLDQASSE